MTMVKLKPCQMEQVTVTYLEQLHADIGEELEQHTLEPFLQEEDFFDLIHTMSAIEVVMKELVFEPDYYEWKAKYGLDLLY